MKKLFILLLVTHFLGVSLFAATRELKLTKKEQAFISQNKTITYVYDPDWAPFEWRDGINDHVGMLADILKLIEEKSGLHFKNISVNSWQEALEKLKSGKATMVSGISSNTKREEYLQFTRNVLFSVPYVFVSHNNNSFSNGFDSMGTQTLAFVKGYAIGEIIEKNHPALTIQTVSSIREGLIKLRNGKIDVLLLNQASAEYELVHKNLHTLSISYKTNYLLPIKIALSKTYTKEALSIIDKAIQSISKKKIHAIYAKYISEDISKESVILSDAEQMWIQENPVVNFVGDPNWLPFEGVNDKGEYIGIVAEYLLEIQKLTGLEFRRIDTKSWNESLSLIKNKKADMISETLDSDLKKELSFTQNYLENPIVIVMKNKARYIDNLSLLKEKKIALIKEYGYTSKIKNSYPNMNFIELDNITTALEAVSSGKVDALLCTMALASYHITHGGFTNLHIIGKTEFTTKLGFGVQKDLALLKSILTKSISVLENGVKQKILKKWTLPQYVEKVDYTLAWQILAVASFLLLLFFYWTRKMSKEISRRKEAEKELEKMLVQQAKMAAMGEMIDSIAHQWKQPLNAISMLSELAEMDYEAQEVDKNYMKEFKMQVDTQIEHLLATLNGFRDFFRPSKKSTRFDVKNALDSLLLLVKDEFMKYTISVEIQEQAPLELDAIENEFKHVVLNIINNAKDAFNENTIVDRNILIKIYEDNTFKIIEISDNAGGIPQNIIADVFKANVTSKEEGKGTGIGLYMSEQIVHKMGGNISVSNENDGARFLIKIPR